jgi:STELLO glycosyltransferases
MKKNSLVITTIAGTNSRLMLDTFEQASKNNCDTIVIADKKTGNLAVGIIRFITVEEQKNSEYMMAPLLPWNSYSRKNLGYLEALKNNSPWIIETDDDNLPSSEFFHLDMTDEFQARAIRKSAWVNIYKYFGNNIVWPRGFPLSKVLNNIDAAPENIELVAMNLAEVGVFQVIADKDPDVDAIFRLTQKLPQSFLPNPPVVLFDGAVCPFNSQATWWSSKYGILMYFPSTVSWRSADIWRSYISTRILQANGIGVAFTKPLVTQIRNVHNLMQDFLEEVDCYLNAEKVWDILSSIDDDKLKINLASALLYTYQSLIHSGIIPEAELVILTAWIQDVETITAHPEI